MASVCLLCLPIIKQHVCPAVSCAQGAAILRPLDVVPSPSFRSFSSMCVLPFYYTGCSDTLMALRCPAKKYKKYIETRTVALPLSLLCKPQHTHTRPPSLCGGWAVALLCAAETSTQGEEAPHKEKSTAQSTTHAHTTMSSEYLEPSSCEQLEDSPCDGGNDEMTCECVCVCVCHSVLTV